MDYNDTESESEPGRSSSDEPPDEARIRKLINWILEDELKSYSSKLREIRERAALTKPRDKTDL